MREIVNSITKDLENRLFRLTKWFGVLVTMRSPSQSGRLIERRCRSGDAAVQRRQAALTMAHC